jgi:hypothetical protein
MGSVMITVKSARNYLLLCCTFIVLMALASLFTGSWGWLISLPVWTWTAYTWGKMYKRLRDDELQRVAAEREKRRRKIDLD